MGLEQIAQSHVNEYSSWKAQCLLRIELQKTSFAVESTEHRKISEKQSIFISFSSVFFHRDYHRDMLVIPSKAVG